MSVSTCALSRLLVSHIVVRPFLACTTPLTTSSATLASQSCRGRNSSTEASSRSQVIATSMSSTAFLKSANRDLPSPLQAARPQTDSDNMSKKDVLLVGYGAVGAVFALILTRGGHANVTVVARSSFDAVQKSGMNFDSEQFGKVSHFRPYRVVKSIQDALDRPYAYAFLATKAVPDVIKTSTILAPLLEHHHRTYSQQPTYVLLQNGLNVEADLYNTLLHLGVGDTPTVVGSALGIVAAFADNVTVRHGNFTRLTIGIYRHDDYLTDINTPSETALLSELASLLEGSLPQIEAGMGKGTNPKVIITPRLHHAKFLKNLWNIVFSPFAALTRSPVQAVFRPPPPPPRDGENERQAWDPYVAPQTRELVEAHTIPAIRAALAEVISIARALGWPDAPESEGGLPSSAADDTIKLTRDVTSQPGSWHRTSMLADVDAGDRGWPKPIEVEVIVGEAVRLAKALGVAVPRLEMLYALLLVVQNQILRRIEEKKSQQKADQA